MAEREVLTAAEAGRRLGCCRGTVYKLFHAGELEGFTLGDRGVRVYADSLTAYQKKKANRPPEQEDDPVVVKTPAPRRRAGGSPLTFQHLKL
jgi:excisionase family DNA binding protein